ncbi:MAG: hypothetical protein L0H59_01165 [Tomitella sp.]|nr:hypothetical protein [Tomitella sp.]
MTGPPTGLNVVEGVRTGIMETVGIDPARCRQVRSPRPIYRRMSGGGRAARITPQDRLRAEGAVG